MHPDMVRLQISIAGVPRRCPTAEFEKCRSEGVRGSGDRSLKYEGSVGARRCALPDNC